MRTLLVAALILGNLIPRQGSIQVTSISLTYSFGEEFNLSAHILSGDPIQEVQVYFQPVGDKVYAGQASISIDGQVTFRYDLSQQPLPPFGKVNYWLKIRSLGEELTTPVDSFIYEDNRFTWESIDSYPIRLYWTDGGIDFGNLIAEIETKGFTSIQGLLPLEPIEDQSIYIYSSRADLESALRFTGIQSISGYSIPEQGVALILAEPGDNQLTSLKQQIPHEMMHLLLYSNYPYAYAKLPDWFLEGMASSVELTTDPNYTPVLQKNARKGSLIPIETLCAPFPRDQESFFLAYAESASFTRYLFELYGSGGLVNLINSYESGSGCSSGTRDVFNRSINQLDQEWQQATLAAPEKSLPLRSLLTYLLISLFVLAIPLTIVMIKKRGFRK